MLYALISPLRAVKPLWFGINGAIGCLLGALLGEVVLFLLLPPPAPTPPRVPVDLVFVLDVTGSMSGELRGVQNGIGQFSSEFSSRGLDPRIGLVAFGDRLRGEEPTLLDFGGEPFTADMDVFRSRVDAVRMVNGGDEPESSLDALALAARLPFRPAAKKVLVLVTDANPQTPDKENATPALVAQVLDERGIDQLHLVTQSELVSVYGLLQKAAPGKVFLLADAAQGREGFDRILAGMGSSIAQTISGVASNQQFSRQSFWKVVGALAAWTSLLAAGITLWLILGQNLYLRKRFAWNRQAKLGLLGGLLAGLLAGGIGQWLFAQGTGGSVWRAVAWALVGGCIGWGIASFVPNLPRRRALQGGAVGGFLGAMAFVFLSGSSGDWAGRLTGATILGFCIGLVLALVEVTTRRAWLEVTRPGSGAWTVTLGPDPVLVGSRETCQVYVRGVEPLAVSYSMDKGQVVREDASSKTLQPVALGDTAIVGDVTITVRGA